MTSEEWRQYRYYQCDPLAKDIEPALLNSVDMKRYIDKGCLIQGSDFCIDRLKTASYEMRFLGELYDWKTTDSGRPQRRCREICDGDKVEISRNSITYLWMKEKLLLPEYIAVRFNLHIRHVHKGILLGTGPLVDPGFFGSLLIPLHNLTDNDYELTGGEGIIWVEFTKVSRNEFWTNPNPGKTGRPCHLASFPSSKNLDNPDTYFNKSGISSKCGVQSAFKGALENAKKASENAKNSAHGAKKAAQDAREENEKIKSSIEKLGIGFAVVISVAIATLIYGGYSLITPVVDFTNEENRRQIELGRNVKSHNDTVQKQIKDLQAQIDGYSTTIEVLKERIDSMNEKREEERNLAQ